MADETQAQFVPHSHLPYGKEGTGFYSDNTLGCFDVVSAAKPLVLRALDEIKKKHGEEKEIMVYYEDQPSNDFKSVINRVNGLIPGPPPYVMNNSDVYTACVGTSFFSKCFPANSIHLGVCFTAMHWLSQRPGTLSTALHHVTSCKKEEIANFQKQAAEDWETILLARAHELVAGGQLVIVCLAIDEEGQYPGKTQRVNHSMYEQMTKHWADMATEGKITQEEFVETNFNKYFRTVEEFSAPLKDPQSKVRQAGLQLVSIESRLVPCHYHRTWLASDKEAGPDTAKAHAKWYVPACRTWSNSTFRAGLNSSRTEEEKDQLTDELFARYEADVASAPGDHAMDHVHAYIHIQKST